MNNTRTLQDAFKQSRYPVPGHGARSIQVLKDALAPLSDEMDSDIYGKGAIIEDFQAKMATFLGKPAAVFFPSGTMAQQIALRIWCDRKNLRKVAYHPLCHLEIHEQNGLKMLHHIEPVLVAEPHRLITLDDVLAIDEEVTCLLLELPQREIGGQLPTYETLEAICAYCKTRGIKLHLDGARLLEVLPFYQKTAAEICALFDSVYVSFYKGIGGVAGAILAGDEDFIAESVIWKRRHGGDLISLYPYIISANYYFEKRKDKMQEYYEQAKALAVLFNRCDGVETNPISPVSNMFHVHFDLPKQTVEDVLVQVCEETGIAFSPSLSDRGEHACSFEISIGDRFANIPQAILQRALDTLSQKLSAFQRKSVDARNP